jgi:sugar-specific transcriptional regulator TrmB
VLKEKYYEEISMQTYEEESQILMSLGLTSLQAKVYLALAKMHSATSKSLALNTKIDRANIYRVINQLEKLELIEKMLMNPVHYKALPVDEGIRMLLESKDSEYLQFKAKTKEVLQKYKSQDKLDTDETDCQFALIPDGKFTEHKVAEMLDSNEKTHDILFYWRDCAYDIDGVVSQWENLLLKGVKVRALIFLSDYEQLPPKILDLKKYGKMFELRRTFAPPKATVSIIDGKQSLISITPKLTPPGNPGLWVNNQTITSLIQEYFDLNWRRSKRYVM